MNKYASIKLKHSCKNIDITTRIDMIVCILKWNAFQI